MDENLFTRIQQQNPNLLLYSTTSTKFKEFAKILPFKDAIDAYNYVRKTIIPQTGNQYVAHDEQFVNELKNTTIFDEIFGYVPLQYGFVNGHNRKINALEFHKSSEVNISVDDMILFFGHARDIQNNTYDLNNAVAFYIPKQTAFEVYPEVLHFSPCAVTNNGFRCAVILPLGTNTDLLKSPTDAMLFKKNKWLLAHKEATHIIERGAQIGLSGVNTEIQLIEENV
jgi:hypothetical protein